MSFFENILNIIKNIKIWDIFDILIVAVLFYYIYKFIKNRRAGRLTLGVIFIILLKLLSELCNMYVIQFILQNIFQIGIIALVVLFQPEIRSGLEKFGTQPLKGLKKIGDSSSVSRSKSINTICKSVSDMSASKTGAIIAIEGLTKLDEIAVSGNIIDSEINEYLLKNIFFDKAPLHDGAVIIRDDKIYSAGCVLPLSGNDSRTIKNLGTRHKAALGLSEISDSIVIVVSEESGVISVAYNGELTRNYDEIRLNNKLYDLLAYDTKLSKIKIKKNKGN